MCEDRPIGYECRCKRGYQLGADSHTCEGSARLFVLSRHTSNFLSTPKMHFHLNDMPTYVITERTVLIIFGSVQCAPISAVLFINLMLWKYTTF